MVNLYDLAMNHEEKDHSHHVYAIKPKVSKDKTSEKKIIDILNSLEKRGLAKSDYFNKWLITDKGIEHIDKYIERGED